MFSSIRSFLGIAKLVVPPTSSRVSTSTTVPAHTGASPIATPDTLRIATLRNSNFAKELWPRSLEVSGSTSTMKTPAPLSKEYADAVRRKYGIATPIGDDTNE